MTINLRSILNREARQTKMDSNGFTIVELMIALSVMAVILIISTLVLIQIGGLYNKGVSASNLQNTARTIVADASSAIQFSGYSSAVSECSPNAAPAGISNACPQGSSYTYKYTFTNNNQAYEYAYCIGTVRYTYILNTELGKDIDPNANNGVSSGQGSAANQVTPDILWRDTLTNVQDPCYPVDMSNPSATSTDPSSGNYYSAGNGYEMMSNNTRLTSFNIGAASGPDSSNTYTITLSSAFGNSSEFDGNGRCMSQINSLNSQFCSTSTISSTVAGRVY